MMAPLPPALADCAKPWRTMRGLAIAAGVVVGVSTVGLLALSGWFIAATAIAGAAGPVAARALNYLIPSAVIRLLAILRTAARYAERLLSHRASLSTLAAVRTRLFAKAAQAEAQRALRLSGGEAATLLGADIDQLEDRLIRGPAIAGAVSASLLAVALGALAGILPALGIALCLGGAGWSTRYLARRVLPGHARTAAVAIADLKVALTEHVAAAGEIAVYGLSDRVAVELERVAERHDDALFALGRAEARIAMLVPVAAGIASALAVSTGGGGVALAAMAALAAAGAGESLAGLARSEIKGPSFDAAVDRLQTLSSVEAPDAAAGVVPVSTIGIVTDRGRRDLAAGARVAITGRSGAGKTRLLETLAGLRADAPQHLDVDGVEAASLGLYQLRRSFALVPQNAMLIAGTILDNVRIARKGLSEAQIWEALTVACLDEEVRAMPDGLEQWIGEAGLHLSGGQRKRLALARGLLAERPWLLLDEPSEGLDADTEARLVARLGPWLDRKGCGVLLVTHRPALRALCDQSVALD